MQNKINKQIYNIFFKGVEDGYLICDIEWSAPEKRKIKVGDKRKTITSRDETIDAKIKLDTNNTKLLEKLKNFKKGENLELEVLVPAFGHTRDIDVFEVNDVLDIVDQLKRRNKNCLIERPIPTQEQIEKIKRKRKSKRTATTEKNQKINELELENSMLNLQIQELVKQIQELKRS